MPARLNHVAIASDHYAVNARFYESLFGMKTSSKPRPARAVVVGDGYVGLNSIPRREGRCSGLDHFGIEVDDLDAGHGFGRTYLGKVFTDVGGEVSCKGRE